MKFGFTTVTRMEHWNICNCGNNAYLPKGKPLIRHLILIISLHTSLFERAQSSVTEDRTTWSRPLTNEPYPPDRRRETSRSRCGSGQSSRPFQMRDQLLPCFSSATEQISLFKCSDFTVTLCLACVSQPGILAAASVSVYRKDKLSHSALIFTNHLD